MINLIIDTTRKQLLIVLLENKTVLLKSNIDSHSKHSNYLMNEISNLFDKSNYKLSDVDNIIVLNGPGSFTGIRVGVTVAKTLAWSLNKKLFVVNNLKALSLSSDSDITLSVISDKKDSSYVGIYYDGKDIEGYFNIEDDVIDFKSKNIQIIAMENSEFLDMLNSKLSINNNVNIKITCEYNYDKLINYAFMRGSINPHNANAVYLKKIDAEK